MRHLNYLTLVLNGIIIPTLAIKVGIAHKTAVNRLTKFESMSSEQCASCIGTRLTRNSVMGESR